ncbi:Threonyl-tRNA synthetase ThrS [Helicobacter ailurogastricus]|uniref:Threonine--tRNA ligase n=1 Tax=Helicobacter ailurogastricus TaxID=1578720 RepID=A0A0K2Y4J9_9HELI|nr:threonine--tRNA ligase [Helicobacter ailurogastricus]GMB89670.1 Threonyl-tRNA synthetase ThrS [Helicobacter ailurogastricus]GMB91261.1 Threonyl-tRNA synthetase ThrS [Helicobacter ailurogastricus]CRF52075.1 Threonyl-tRNA synthetase [Helicobacter ailurogastricus]
MAEKIGVRKEGEIYDLQSLATQEGEAIYFGDNDPALEIIRHSCAHLLAQAIKQLYPDAQFFVGPVVQEGFYYDFKTSSKISEEDLERIEERMRAIAKNKHPITKSTMTRKEALEKFKDDPLKHAVMSRIAGDSFSVYSQGEFEDLCRGPHLPHTGLLQHFKLTKLAGAYLGGDENAEMLQRIYGIAFASKEALKEYLFQLEEAKKRDHRKLGQELGLFCFNEDLGAGLPIWLPNGMRLRQRIENLLSKALLKYGYEPVRGPEILKSSLWQTSGHYQNYKENMYFTTIDEVEYGIKPMNCVGHIKVYEHALRSYKDLPLRFYEYGVVHRHEKSGVLHGLLRVREFTQDDAHIFCRFNQIKAEVLAILEFTKKVMEVFGFSYEMELSTKPEKHIGEAHIWEQATTALKEALEEQNISFGIDAGGGAFYGPKIDIKITDAIKRKWQCGTVQVDMNLPERFNLSYANEQDQEERPVMIHRAILGSFERFIAILTEHYGGNYPFFIAPVQIALVPVSSDQLEYAKALQTDLVEKGFFVQLADKNETLSKRIRTLEKQKIPFIAVLGQQEVAQNSVAVRDRALGQQYSLSKTEFIQQMEAKMQEVSF